MDALRTSRTTVWTIFRTPTSTTTSALKWAGGSRNATRRFLAWRDCWNAWATSGDWRKPSIWRRLPSNRSVRSPSIPSPVTCTTPISTKWRCCSPTAPTAFPFPRRCVCSSTPTSTSSSSVSEPILPSIPELVSHICSHLKGEETLGLEATERCLHKYPGNAALQQNRKVFQNRLRATAYTPLSHITLSTPTLSPHSRVCNKQATLHTSLCTS